MRVVKASIVDVKKDEVVDKLRKAVSDMFGEHQWVPFASLMGGESGFDPWVVNQKSHACGIFQAYPCHKTGGKVYWNEEMGKWRLDPESFPVDAQVAWGMKYIKDRYGSPQMAYSHWLAKVPIMLNGKLTDVGHWY